MKFIKNNIKVIIAFIIGLIISGTGVYAATILFQGDQVGFDNTTSNLMKQNGDPVETVQEAVEALNRKIACPYSPFKVGDYIDMTPTTNTSTTISTLSGVSGSITPSELNVWRVIKINTDCTVEVVSEYVSSTDVTLEGKDGYKNMVYGLNEYAKLYANTTYTLDPSAAPDGAFRNVGYNGQTPKITDETRITNSSLGAANGLWNNKSTPLNGEESLGGGDYGFTKDLNLIHEAGVSETAYMVNTTTPTTYWLASRLFIWVDTSRWHFHARYVLSHGAISDYYLYYWDYSSFSSRSRDFAVRPIITLKSGLTTSSGNGTSSSHYQISVS